MKFLESFTNTLFQVFKDNPDAKGYAQVLETYDPVFLKKMNNQGCGIYFTPNGFTASNAEKDELWEKLKLKDPTAKRPTARKKEFLRNINAVFADLDVAKEGEKVSNNAKKELVDELKRMIVPNYIINTKNGIQPIWLVDEDKIDKDTQDKFVKVIMGIIEWSKKHGAKGDIVKDVTRVLRMPNYNHMKGDPFMCKAYKMHDTKTTLDEMEKIFPYENKMVKPDVQKTIYKKNNISLEIDRLDFQELIIRAFASTGRPASFDTQKRLILDGRLTGTHQGKIGSGDFLASSSHEPFEGNRITAVADILGVTNKEARAWIVEEYSLKEKVTEKKKKEVKSMVDKIIKTDKEKEIQYLFDEIDSQGEMFTWGTENLDKYITPIEKHHFIILAGLNNAGKTAFAFDVAYKNAKNNKKVLFLSLEMTRRQIFKRVALSYARISKEQWHDRRKIQESQKIVYKNKLKTITDIKNLELLGFSHDQTPTVEAIFEVIERVNPDLTIVDNFDLIAKEPGANEWQEQQRIAEKFMTICHDKNRPVIVIHHKNSKQNKQGIGGNRGSGKIGDDCDIALNCSREWEKDASEIDNARFVVAHDKDRDFGQYNMVEVFFKNGTFVDEFTEKPRASWQDKI